MLGELLFIASASVALWHASRRGHDHQLVWLAALVAGTANDFIFMALPLVDNFWQAQGTIMLTPRMLVGANLCIRLIQACVLIGSRRRIAHRRMVRAG